MTVSEARLRPFKSSDAISLVKIYHDAVVHLGREAYSTDQRRVWQMQAPSVEQFQQAYLDGRSALVALDSTGRISGFSDLKPDGHIQFLYVSPHAAGRGFARELLAEHEKHACVEGIPKLHAEASAVALRVFQKSGFQTKHRRDFTIDNVLIHNFAVEKHLC